MLYVKKTRKPPTLPGILAEQQSILCIIFHIPHTKNHTNIATHSHNGILVENKNEWNINMCNNMEDLRILCQMKVKDSCHVIILEKKTSVAVACGSGCGGWEILEENLSGWED